MVPKDMRIVLASVNNVKELVQLRYALLQEFEEAPITLNEFSTQCLPVMQTFLQSEQWRCWVAEQDKNIIGSLWLQKVDKIPSFTKPLGCWGYITNMFVVREFRNKGVGTRLLNTVKEYAKSEQYELLIVWPSDASIAFYQRAGFKSNDQLYELKYTF